jgi:hypothetical protein
LEVQVGPYVPEVGMLSAVVAAIVTKKGVQPFSSKEQTTYFNLWVLGSNLLFGRYT